MTSTASAAAPSEPSATPAAEPVAGRRRRRGFFANVFLSQPQALIGLIWGFLQGDLQLGLNYGTAMAALKHSIPGDEFAASREEVEMLLESASQEIQR